MTRLDALRDKMLAENIDLVALGPGAHLEWLTGLHPHGDERPLLLIITQSTAAFLMPVLEADSARQHTDLPFYTWSDDAGPQGALDDLLTAAQAANARSIALDETMRADFAALVQDTLLQAQRQFTATTIGTLRMRKDAAEIATLKRNAQTADTAMQAAWAAMKPGMTEWDVAEIIRDSFKGQGATPLFHIVGAGPNGAFPHHQTGSTILQQGDAVVMDLGGSMDGYSSDITRMAVLGNAPEGYAEIHAIVEAAVQAAMQAARPGVRAGAVDAAARDVITKAGYGDYFMHRTGHGMGVEIHEPPYITATSDTVLETGMVFSIEPGIYLPGRFGIRLEDIVVLRNDGPQVLSDLPRDLRIIGD
ncbi:aminopeptidase P family protein [Sulfitobacter sp. TSTF-M16]|uniref:Aminopeptidase P family protein n=1 Tax=Sulfitobacter aestuariivivens TaxID=2766981 RepID=A0A927D4F2_9RHOB|nr:Xaa-Pro peptidase family protein [Sulfitobacter aestuariivivens]MBD3664789.1 aminopeptidase P family protein [Sulfitobacter aestuariivivens]